MLQSLLLPASQGGESEPQQLLVSKARPPLLDLLKRADRHLQFTGKLRLRQTETLAHRLNIVTKRHPLSDLPACLLFLRVVGEVARIVAAIIAFPAGIQRSAALRANVLPRQLYADYRMLRREAHGFCQRFRHRAPGLAARLLFEECGGCVDDGAIKEVRGHKDAVALLSQDAHPNLANLSDVVVGRAAFIDAYEVVADVDVLKPHLSFSLLMGGLDARLLHCALLNPVGDDFLDARPIMGGVFIEERTLDLPASADAPTEVDLGHYPGEAFALVATCEPVSVSLDRVHLTLSLCLASMQITIRVARSQVNR